MSHGGGVRRGEAFGQQQCLIEHAAEIHRFAHGPANFGTVLDEALLLAEGFPATDPATVGHVQPWP